MDRKHIKFSVDAQEYQKLLKEENEELKEKIICLESDACNEVSQAQFDDAMEDKDIEIKKLQETIKILEDIHSGDMKIVKMLKEKWNEEQEENKKLKEEFDGWKASYDDDIREARAEGIDELQEENEELKKDIEFLKL